MSYNGWKNYETWNVALWIGNEQGSYNESVKLTRRLVDDPSDDEQIGTLACAIKDWVEGMMPDLGASMASDLLTAALSEVDWYEIAQAWANDYCESASAAGGGA